MLALMTRRPRLLLCALLVLSCLLRPSSPYTVNTDRLGPRFDGIGGLSGGGATSRLLPDYIEPQRSQILDYMFTPHFGIAMQILKVEIGGDGQSTQGTEASHMHTADDENYERGYEWWLMKEAKRRNPAIKLYGLAWAWPAWLGEGGSLPFTNSTIRYVMRWLEGARQHHNLTIDHIGLWNEHPYDRSFTLALRDAITAAQLPTTIVAADSCPPGSFLWSICDSVIDDAEWAAAFPIIGSHYIEANTTDNCHRLGKTLWESEALWADYHEGACWSSLVNRNHVYANITATIAWNANAAYLKGLPDEGTGLMASPSPWAGFYGVDAVVWASAHTTHFTEPGTWSYLAPGSGVGVMTGGGTYVTLTDGHELTIIVESMVVDASNCTHDPPPSTPVSKQNVTFVLSGAVASKVTTLHVFYSSFAQGSTDAQWFVYRGQVAVTDHLFTFILSPNEQYTFSTVNSTKGGFPDSPIPTETPFPTQYSDDFDSYAVHSQPRYLTDQSGSYEIAQAADTTHGRVLRQMVPVTPIAWCIESPLTYTVVGSHQWRAMNTSVDVFIEKTIDGHAAVAFLGSSVADAGCLGSGSRGIVLAVAANGTFIVSNSTGLQKRLDEGSVAVKAGEWHQLRVVVDEQGGSFYVDGQLVSHLASLSTNFAAGWVGLGSSFDHVQFDNLRIDAGTTTAMGNGEESLVQEEEMVRGAAEDGMLAVSV